MDAGETEQTPDTAAASDATRAAAGKPHELTTPYQTVPA